MTRRNLLMIACSACVLMATSLVTAEDAPKKTLDIVDTAVAGKFNTLVAALKAGDLVEPLKGEGPFTVFAPSDEAFDALPSGTLDDLLKPENKEKLQAVLKYHVIPAKVTAVDAMKLDDAKTAQGNKLKIVTKDGRVMINNAKVLKPDVMCSNGIVHVIDKVLMPQQAE